MNDNDVMEAAWKWVDIKNNVKTTVLENKEFSNQEVELEAKKFLKVVQKWVDNNTKYDFTNNNQK